LGILPAPLAPTPLGYNREDRRWGTSKTPPLTLKFESLAQHYFRPEGVSDDFLREALGPPTFFHKIVVAECDRAVEQAAAKAATDYFTGKREKLAALDHQLAALETAAGAANSQAQIAALHKEREKLQPSWLSWKTVDPRGDAEQLPVSDLAERAQPEVLARYNNDLPMLVRRRWGRGQVLFLTTSLSREWTTLHELPQSAWLMDRIARCILSETLTAWNVSSEKSLVLPVSAGDRGARFTLINPEGKPQSLGVDALVGDLYGIGLNDLTQRGIYHVKALRRDASDANAAAPANGDSSDNDSLLWDIPLAVNGPADESQLVPMQKSQADGKSFADASAQIDSASPMQLEGVDFWKWLIGLMLVLLLAELLLAARSTSRREAA
jgi:hypothetical protein